MDFTEGRFLAASDRGSGTTFMPRTAASFLKVFIIYPIGISMEKFREYNCLPTLNGRL